MLQIIKSRKINTELISAIKRLCWYLRAWSDFAAQPSLLPVKFQEPPEPVVIPSHWWMLAVYGWGIISRLDHIKASTTSIFGSIPKMNSTKTYLLVYICEQWEGLILISVLTAMDGPALDIMTADLICTTWHRGDRSDAGGCRNRGRAGRWGLWWHWLWPNSWSTGPVLWPLICHHQLSPHSSHLSASLCWSCIIFCNCSSLYFTIHHPCGTSTATGMCFFVFCFLFFYVTYLFYLWCSVTLYFNYIDCFRLSIWPKSHQPSAQPLSLLSPPPLQLLCLLLDHKPQQHPSMLYYILFNRYCISTTPPPLAHQQPLPTSPSYQILSPLKPLVPLGHLPWPKQHLSNSW